MKLIQLVLTASTLKTTIYSTSTYLYKQRDTEIVYDIVSEKKNESEQIVFNLKFQYVVTWSRDDLM